MMEMMEMMTETGGPELWRKSSYSGANNGNCVELAGSLSAVRDSKNPQGPVLRVDLAAFLGAVKAGRFDA